MTKKQLKHYTNEAPPIKDRQWRYDSHTDVMARFKALGWIPPTQKRGTK